MPHGKKKSDEFGRRSSGWRKYQSQLKRDASRRHRLKRLPKYSLAAVALILLTFGLFGLLSPSGCSQGDVQRQASSSEPDLPAGGPIISKSDVRRLLARADLCNLENQPLSINLDGKQYRVDLNLDIPLQKYLLKRLDRRNSRYIGIVLMEPSSGRVLAMVGYDRTGKLENPCTESRFPAASIFKIVTASAAIESEGLKPDSVLTYNGRKYTLYKSQLDDRKNRWTRKVSLKRSFAESINPVFGKLGRNLLGQETLQEYATAYGFNRTFGLELTVPPSAMSLTDDPYHWAEVACGFNRETKISPLHGAMIASVIPNGGLLMAPLLVDAINDESGGKVYQGRPAILNRVLGADSARQVADLMRSTIRSGTSSKAFRGYRRDRLLAGLEIGGKTGSIDTPQHDGRYDWFVGYADENKGSGQLAVSVIVLHEKYIGKRASQYAREAIRYWAEAQEKKLLNTKALEPKEKVNARI